MAAMLLSVLRVGGYCWRLYLVALRRFRRLNVALFSLLFLSALNDPAQRLFFRRLRLALRACYAPWGGCSAMGRALRAMRNPRSGLLLATQ